MEFLKKRRRRERLLLLQFVGDQLKIFRKIAVLVELDDHYQVSE